MQSGFNKRVFNSEEYLGDGESTIKYNGEGDITFVAGGIYKISGVSIVTYMDLENHSEATSDFPGYCTLLNDSGEQLATGTISNARNLLPSTFETIVDVPANTTVSVQHQVGNNVENVWLGIAANGSQNHVYARLVLEQLWSEL